MSETARPVGAVRAIVGESPVWCEADRCIYWVDILGGLVHRYETDTGSDRYWRMPEQVGNLVLVDGGGLLIAMEGGLHLFTPETGALRTLCDIRSDIVGQRFNDGTCDPRGRLWIGSMTMEEPVERAVGALFRFDRDGTIARVLDGFLVPNGMAFSPDGSTFYISDSHPSVQTIWAFDHDLDAGALSNRRVFATTHDLPGRPDGGTVDADGFYWSANVSGGCLVRFDPDGRIDRSIDVPTEKPSKIAFGGPSLDVMYVTSINHKLENHDTRGLAGSLFRLDAGIRGLPPNLFGPLEPSANVAERR